MKKIDLHLHCVPEPVPRTDTMFVSTGAEMVPHLEELGIEKAVLMSAGEQASPLGSNESNRRICAENPVRYAWMCNLDPAEPETIRQRLARYKEQGAVGIGELMINRPLDDPFLREIFAVAGELGLPVTFHMSPQVGFGYGVVDDPGLQQQEKLAIVLGTEGAGLAAETIAKCDATVMIPMQHGVDSLNVGAAAAVAFWQLRAR